MHSTRMHTSCQLTYLGGDLPSEGWSLPSEGGCRRSPFVRAGRGGGVTLPIALCKFSITDGSKTIILYFHYVHIHCSSVTQQLYPHDIEPVHSMVSAWKEAKLAKMKLKLLLGKKKACSVS